MLRGVVGATLAIVTGCGATAAPAAGRSMATDYTALAARATGVLEQRYYTGSGTWRMCVPAICRSKNFDWGADSLTDTLFLHWQLTADRRVKPIMAALTATAKSYGPAAGQWSDVPMWDAVADLREYRVTGDPVALAKAEAAFAQVDTVGAAAFAAGACPRIDYQARGGGSDKLKTLETDANYIKAAILLYQATGTRSYLVKAERKYAAVRTYFLGKARLYTVYLFDAGTGCTALPGRYYGSVNGLMIWSGAMLARLTGHRGYLAEAIATARAVRKYLSDAAGVYADLQAENDVAEPLVEAMYLLATAGHQLFARRWLLTCASAAASDVSATGAYGRFFDGPPPRVPVTAWQVNGGAALMIAAAALDPHGGPAARDSWRRAVFVSDNARLLPAKSVRITFTGSAIAIIGTLGERCCQAGHASVAIDGRRTFDRTGIWQDKSSSARRIPGTIVFAWRWPAAGRHVITIGPAPFNAKEGGPFFHMTGYYLIR